MEDFVDLKTIMLFLMLLALMRFLHFATLATRSNCEKSRSGRRLLVRNPASSSLVSLGKPVTLCWCKSPYSLPHCNWIGAAAALQFLSTISLARSGVTGTVFLWIATVNLERVLVFYSRRSACSCGSILNNPLTLDCSIQFRNGKET